MLFWVQALSERAEGGSINLDDLGPDSPLGTMLTLEALRFKGGPLDKVRLSGISRLSLSRLTRSSSQDVVKNGKNVLLGGMHDAVVKIPACGMSFVVDRLIRGAVQAAVAAGHEQTLREMARDWPFFRTFLDDIAMVLSKGDITIAEQFSLLSGELHGHFFPQVQRELELTRHWLLALMDQRTLLDHDARLALSIRLRNPYVDPISVLQVDLLQRWRASGREDDGLLRALVACVNGVAQGVQNTG